MTYWFRLMQSRILEKKKVFILILCWFAIVQNWSLWKFEANPTWEENQPQDHQLSTLNYFISLISCYKIPFDNCFISGLDEPWLWLANRKNVRQASLDGNVYNDVLTNLNRTVAIDFDINEGQMYWADVIDNAIYRTSIKFEQGGSHPSEVCYKS